MTDKQIYFAFSEAGNYGDIDAFVSDIATSFMMDPKMSDDEFLDYVVPESVLAQICDIWECYHYSMQDISEISGLNQAQMSIRFMIPLRTIQHWYNGDRKIPMYIKILICENLGLWKR